MKLLIIGTGIAALSAAEAFRKQQPDAEILMLGRDAHLPYFRIKLSHLLAKPDVTENEVLVKKPEWYEAQRITLRTDTSVTSVDFGAKTALLASGETIPWDRLLLATGAQPFVPPVPGADLPGVFTLRTLDDLRAIHAALAGKEKVLVVGGGLLGLEAAHGLVTLGKRVHVLEAFPYLLPRQLDPHISDAVRRQLEAEGMTFTLGTACARVETAPTNGNGASAVTGMRLTDGRLLEADVILFSAGIRPDIRLAAGSPLAVNRGILVDAGMRTNLPDVYAAGDVAEIEGKLYGLWAPAMEQGRVAGTNLAGGDASYAPAQVVTTLSIGQVRMFSTGEIADAEAHITQEGDGILHRAYVRGGRPAGVVLTGDLGLANRARALVREGTALPDANPANVSFEDLFPAE